MNFGERDPEHFVSKSWGHEDIIANNNSYCGKRMYIESNKYSSVHFHKIKNETFYIQAGILFLQTWRDGLFRVYTLSPGMCFDMPANVIHRFYTGDMDCVFFEFSTPHSDEDVYRILKGGSGEPSEVNSLEVNEDISFKP